MYIHVCLRNCEYICMDLQCVAVCCSVLQRVVVRCSVLQCVAVCCNILQRSLQCVTVSGDVEIDDNVVKSHVCVCACICTYVYVCVCARVCVHADMGWLPLVGSLKS